MKTVKEWLDELPEPYRTQALEQTSNFRLKETEDTMYSTLLGIFPWYDSHEGNEYWRQLSDVYRKHEVALQEDLDLLTRKQQGAIDFFEDGVHLHFPNGLKLAIVSHDGVQCTPGVTVSIMVSQGEEYYQFRDPNNSEETHMFKGNISTTELAGIIYEVATTESIKTLKI